MSVVTEVFPVGTLSGSSPERAAACRRPALPGCPQLRLVSPAVSTAVPTPAPAGRGDRSPEPGTLRLTRRGVVVLWAATGALAAAMLLIAHVSAGARGRPASGVRPGAAVTVQPGDTLWAVATSIAPDEDPRLVLDKLRRINHLTRVAIAPGQILHLH